MVNNWPRYFQFWQNNSRRFACLSNKYGFHSVMSAFSVLVCNLALLLAIYSSTSHLVTLKCGHTQIMWSRSHHCRPQQSHVTFCPLPKSRISTLLKPPPHWMVRSMAWSSLFIVLVAVGPTTASIFCKFLLFLWMIIYTRPILWSIVIALSIDGKWIDSIRRRLVTFHKCTHLDHRVQLQLRYVLLHLHKLDHM